MARIAPTQVLGVSGPRWSYGLVQVPTLEYRLRAIGGAAVVNRLAHFYLEKRGA